MNGPNCVPGFKQVNITFGTYKSVVMGFRDKLTSRPSRAQELDVVLFREVVPTIYNIIYVLFFNSRAKTFNQILPNVKLLCSRTKLHSGYRFFFFFFSFCLFSEIP